MSGSIVVTGMSAGELAGQRILGPITMVGKAVIGETIVMPLQAGDNVITVPAESIAVMIVSPLGSGIVVKLRTSKNAGDVGLPLPETSFPFVYPFPTTIPTTITLNAASLTAAVSITFI